MAEISPETGGLTHEEAEKLQHKTERERAAQEFLAAQETAGKQGGGFGVEEAKPVIPTPDIKTFLEQQPPARGEVSDLTDQILKSLEGKTDGEKINILLNRKGDPAAISEAMSRIIEEQERAA